MAPRSAQRAAADRRYALRKRYGITPEEYDQMLEAQGGVCALCGRKPGRVRLAVDHSHITGMVRGLVCAVPCNRQVIKAIDDGGIEQMARAHTYISRMLADQQTWLLTPTSSRT